MTQATPENIAAAEAELADAESKIAAANQAQDVAPQAVLSSGPVSLVIPAELSSSGFAFVASDGERYHFVKGQALSLPGTIADEAIAAAAPYGINLVREAIEGASE